MATESETSPRNDLKTESQPSLFTTTPNNAAVQPSVPYSFDFGRNRGKTLAECDPSYIAWLVKNNVAAARPNLKAALDLFISSRKSQSSPITPMKRAAPESNTESARVDQQTMSAATPSSNKRAALALSTTNLDSHILQATESTAIKCTLPWAQVALVDARKSQGSASKPYERAAPSQTTTSPDPPKIATPSSDFLMPFGRHKGHKLSQVPGGYMKWLGEQAKRKQIKDPKVLAAVTAYLNERSGADETTSNIPSKLLPLVNPNKFVDKFTGEEIWITFFDARKFFGMSKEHVAKIPMAIGVGATVKRPIYWLSQIWQLMVESTSQTTADKAVEAFLGKNKDVEDDILGGLGLSMTGPSLAECCDQGDTHDGGYDDGCYLAQTSMGNSIDGEYWMGVLRSV